jgi:DNA adenine methylase
MITGNKRHAKPFLKWAGGKTRLIPAIKSTMPNELQSTPFTYVEPFIGSGAVFFWFLRHFPNITKAVINDVNKDLTDTYLTIKLYPNDLVRELKELEKEYHGLSSQEKQKDLFLNKRALFNSRKNSIVIQSSLMIFLNRICFNGLYRVNRKNQFNVPFGKYSNPRICDEENIYNVSAALEHVAIMNQDYSSTLAEVQGNAFFYFDPPYKPLSQTASFNSYAKGVFDDNEQQRLKSFCDELDRRNFNWLLSNSDPKNTDLTNHFFEDLYGEYRINRVRAKRMINSVASKRGEIFELLIHNYELGNVPALF